MAAQQGTSTGSRWDLSRWTSGPVTLWEALGIKADIQYPALQPSLQDMPVTVNKPGPQNTGQTSTSPAPAPVSSGNLGKSEAANKALGQHLAAAYGWNSGAQWTALNNIVMAESGWNNTADNPQSGAYGIAQALPPTKYPKAGQPPWLGGRADPATQIRWMLSYIKSTYGNPVNAWAFHVRNGWY